MGVISKHELPVIESSYLAQYYHRQAGLSLDIFETINYNKAVDGILKELKDKHPLKVIFLDLDDVIFDWKGFILANYPDKITSFDEFNALPADERNQVLIDIYQERPNLFAELPLVKGALELIAMLQQLPLELHCLSAIGDTHPNPEIAAIDKVNAAEALGLTPHLIHVVERSADKLNYVNKSAILIDDFKRTCESWASEGGLAYHYNGDASVAEIRELIHHYI